jgi:hypothetical protein
MMDDDNRHDWWLIVCVGVVVCSSVPTGEGNFPIEVSCPIMH